MNFVCATLHTLPLGNYLFFNSNFLVNFGNECNFSVKALLELIIHLIFYFTGGGLSHTLVLMETPDS